MNEQELTQTDEIPLTDEIVVAFLQDNPDFFTRNPELLTSLRLQDNQRGTVSLVERQQQQLRQKVHGLEEEITQLMAIANHNEQLFKLYSDLYLKLIDSQDTTELLDCLHQVTVQLLSLAELKLWLTSSFTAEHSCISAQDCAGIMQNRLANEDYYFGRLQQAEQEKIFGESNVGSVVLVKLTHLDTDIGFLAISSNDAEHFDPRMDTLLLSQFRKLVAKLLYQQLN